MASLFRRKKIGDRAINAASCGQSIAWVSRRQSAGAPPFQPIAYTADVFVLVRTQ